MKERTAIILILLTACISGFSIFLNKFAVANANALVFTTMKNILVSVFLLSTILLIKEARVLKTLSKKNWRDLAMLGFVGGSVPFLLFFFALQSTSAVNAGFLHKTIFVFATIFAFFFHKEKISKSFIAAACLLLAGNYLLFSGISAFSFADALIIAAVLLWAIENVFAKCIFQHNQQITGNILGFSRMFFGSIFMLAFLFFTNQSQFLFSQPPLELEWVLLTSIPLFFYVLFYYNGLKELPVHKATALLLLGQPITAMLSAFFLHQTISISTATGIILTLAGALLVIGLGFFASFLSGKKLIIIKTH